MKISLKDKGQLSVYLVIMNYRKYWHHWKTTHLALKTR